MGGRPCKAVTQAQLHRALWVPWPLRLTFMEGAGDLPCRDGPSWLPGQPWRAGAALCASRMQLGRLCLFPPQRKAAVVGISGCSYFFKFPASDSTAAHACEQLNGDHTHPGTSTPHTTPRRTAALWRGVGTTLPAPGMRAFLKLPCPCQEVSTPRPGEGIALGLGCALLPCVEVYLGTGPAEISKVLPFLLVSPHDHLIAVSPPWVQCPTE